MNSFLTSKLLTHHFGRAIVFISVSSEFKCNSTDVSEEVLHIGRTQEEADTKIIVHVKHCLLNGFRNIIVKTIDTDVVTLLQAHLSLLDSPYEIEVDFNFGKDGKFYKINDICSRITPEQQLALLLFFTFTSCDITSSFFDISKSTWWNVWCQNPYITETFTKLSWTPDKVEENDLNLIEKYVCAAYDPHNRFHTNDVNGLRFLLFTKSCENKLRKLPPTREALQLHILRSAYTTGWIWGVTLQPSDQIPSPVDWGWKYSKDNRFAVDWCGTYDVNLNEYIFTCTCKGLYTRCKCVKEEVSCLPFCSCACIASQENIVG